jgi:thiol-disulfide isomerase/thioredoxin
MKYTIAILSIIALVSCKNSVEKNTDEIAEDQQKVPITYTLTQEVNNEFEDTEDGGMMLLGKINRAGLTTDPYVEWFNENHAMHPLDTITIDSIKPLLNNVKIIVFMGTWCEDSQREVPALYKVLDATGFDYDKFEIIAVTHDKETPNSLEKGHRIAYVPTIIFTKEGDTLNRIVEYTQQTLEQDMLTILQGEAYTPAYSEED